MPPKVTVRLIKHNESYEVRVSTYFYFDDNPGRRPIRREEAVTLGRQ